MSSASPNQPPSYDTVIIGAGVAGLTCAIELTEAGQKVLLIEGEDRVGGRVATDEVEGFRLDRGFQVLLTAYPEARRYLDYDALKLKKIYPGALVRYNRHMHRVADPFRRPVEGIAGALNPIGTLSDKLLVGRLRITGFNFSRHPNSVSALQALEAEGFSEKMIDRFFRPFLGGVFLETQLSTSVRKMEEVLRNFALGDAALPLMGMGSIPEQLAGKLPAGTIRLNTRVVECHSGKVTLADGEHIEAGAVVIATDVRSAQRLLGHEGREAPMNSVSCLYFDTPAPPPIGAILVLNGEGRGPVNNLIAMSEVNSACSPPGRHLVSVSVVKSEAEDGLEEKVKHQLESWFGESVAKWRLLRHYRIKEAIPARPPHPVIPMCIEPGLYSCGDYHNIASLNSAMASGRTVAHSLLKNLP
jgi:phytoene dehydrogenase-like protein